VRLTKEEQCIVAGKHCLRPQEVVPTAVFYRDVAGPCLFSAGVVDCKWKSELRQWRQEYSGDAWAIGSGCGLILARRFTQCSWHWNWTQVQLW